MRRWQEGFHGRAVILGLVPRICCRTSDGCCPRRCCRITVSIRPPTSADPRDKPEDDGAWCETAADDQEMGISPRIEAFVSQRIEGSCPLPAVHLPGAVTFPSPPSSAAPPPSSTASPSSSGLSRGSADVGGLMETVIRQQRRGQQPSLLRQQILGTSPRMTARP